MSPQSSPSSIESYLDKIDLQSFLESLEASNVDLIIREVEHFTEKEAEKRDNLLLDYFGESGIEKIADSIVDCILAKPKPGNNAKILDVGAGSGLFTIKVGENIHRQLSEASFFAMDVTPAMIAIVSEKTHEIIPFLGIAENIAGSIEYSRKYIEIPTKFDVVFSTLMLHHCQNIEKVFRSIREVLRNRGKVVIIDLCEHQFEEFREEMGDIHLGFNTHLIVEFAKRYFSRIEIKKISGIRCESSGRSAELFILYLTNF
jgi:SAM-dependent methyltransferase